MAITCCSPNRPREKVSLRVLLEGTWEREVKEIREALSPSLVRVIWDTRVAGPERESRQLPGNVIRKRPGGQVVWGFANESERWAFNWSDRGKPLEGFEPKGSCGLVYIFTGSFCLASILRVGTGFNVEAEAPFYEAF